MKITDIVVEVEDITPDAERKIERIGRRCYKSDAKISETSHKSFIESRLKEGHYGITEHAWATFRVVCSRAMSHQIVRHRMFSFMQVSQRYVDGANFGYIVPPSIAENADALKTFTDLQEHVLEAYNRLRSLNILKEDARFVLTNACETEITISGNFRMFLEMFQLRLEPHAQWEVRKVAIEMYKILTSQCPTIFNKETCGFQP